MVNFQEFQAKGKIPERKAGHRGGRLRMAPSSHGHWRKKHFRIAEQQCQHSAQNSELRQTTAGRRVKGRGDPGRLWKRQEPVLHT